MNNKNDDMQQNMSVTDADDTSSSSNSVVSQTKDDNTPIYPQSDDANSIELQLGPELDELKILDDEILEDLEDVDPVAIIKSVENTSPEITGFSIIDPTDTDLGIPSIDPDHSLSEFGDAYISGATSYDPDNPDINYD